MVRYHRKIYRRKRSTLSNYKIATRTSVKAQSRQIYALKKRVSRIYRMTKPEIRIQQRNSSAITLNADSTGNVVSFATTGASTAAAIVPLLGSAVSVVSSATPVNNFARLRSFNLYGNLEYSTLTETVQPVTVRVVIVQSKTTRAENLQYQDIFNSGTTASSTSPFNSVFGPLQYGLARTCNVLSDKRYVLSYQRPSIVMRTNLRRLLSYYRDTTGASADIPSDPIAKGSIYVFYAVYGQGLSADNTATINFTYKLAFFDN